MFREPDVEVVRAWDPITRYKWDFYLSRFETHQHRTEVMLARIACLLSNAKNKSPSDFMIQVPQFEGSASEVEQSKELIAQMLAHNEAIK